MARIVQFADDYSGEVVTADQINADLKFSIGDEKWVIDATDQTVELMRQALAPFTSKARIVLGSKPPKAEISTPNGTVPIPTTPASTNGSTNGSTSGEATNDEIRAWARERGYKPAERGKIPANIVMEYQATH